MDPTHQVCVNSNIFMGDQVKIYIWFLMVMKQWSVTEATLLHWFWWMQLKQGEGEGGLWLCTVQPFDTFVNLLLTALGGLLPIRNLSSSFREWGIGNTRKTHTHTQVGKVGFTPYNIICSLYLSLSLCLFLELCLWPMHVLLFSFHSVAVCMFWGFKHQDLFL